MPKNKLAIAIVVSLIVLGLGVRYGIYGRYVPAGQPGLGELTSNSLDTLKADFNGAADKVRIVLLLSPT